MTLLSLVFPPMSQVPSAQILQGPLPSLRSSPFPHSLASPSCWHLLCVVPCQVQGLCSQESIHVEGSRHITKQLRPHLTTSLCKGDAKKLLSQLFPVEMGWERKGFRGRTFRRQMRRTCAKALRCDITTNAHKMTSTVVQYPHQNITLHESTDTGETRAILENRTKGQTVYWHYSLF